MAVDMGHENHLAGRAQLHSESSSHALSRAVNMYVAKLVNMCIDSFVQGLRRYRCANPDATCMS